MIRLFCTVAIALLCITACTPVRYALAPTKERSLQDRFDSIELAEEALATFVDATVDVVSPVAEQALNRARYSGVAVPIDPETTIASGTVVDEGRYILTAAHVATLSSEFLLLGRGAHRGEITPAKVVWCSLEADLALLEPERHLPTALQWSTSVSVGQSVYLIGLTGKHSAGTVISIDAISADMHSVKHSAPIRGGDSGGPLLDDEGRLIGISTRIEFGLIRYRYSEAIRLDVYPQPTGCDETAADQNVAPSH